MIDIKEKEDCCGCNACYNICPASCISIEQDEEGFLYPIVDKSKCIKCGKCINVCPMINEKKYVVELGVYGAKSKDIDIKFKSSSGGMFSILANYVLENNGRVFGAAFNEEFKVIHIEVDSNNNLQRLRGSKYVQSNIGDLFKKIEEYLQQNQLVLFSGTPCQIAGLNNYLNEKYDNLILIDVVCHGVPSPGIYEKYLSYMKNKFKSEIKDISFRAKQVSLQALKISFVNGKTYIRNPGEDLFYRAFSSNLILRPSCYNCKHNNFRSGSDITLADYWGASNKFSDYDENKGVSLVITKTKKGQDLFNVLKDKFEYVDTDIKHAIIKNPNIIKSSDINSKREDFFHDYKNRNLSIDKLLIQYVYGPLYIRILRRGKRIIKKIIGKM